MKSFGELWMETKGAPLDYEGQTVFPIYVRKITGKTIITIRRKTHKQEIPRGIQIAIEGNRAMLQINGERGKQIMLWSDTSPDEIEILADAKAGADIMIWNAWKIDGIKHAWTGNAGMLISENNNKVLLSCSDGFKAPDFTNLVVEIEFKQL